MNSAIIADLCEAGRFLLENELTWGNAGNLSARLNAENYVITASGTHLGELTAGDFVECTLRGEVISEGKPSKETPMHQAVYEMRPDIHAVLHVSPFYATLIACSDVELPQDWFVENMYYMERVARIGYFHPGSKELGLAVRKRAEDASIILMENHGVLVYDHSLPEALMGLQTLEMVCHMVVTVRGAGIEMKSLSPDTVSDFLKHSGYRPPRQWRN